MPVVKTSKTFRQIRDDAEDKYKSYKPASALVYHGGSPQDFIGIRIECSGVRKEFVSNIAFGRDPKGNLYYNDVNSLTGECSYSVEFNVGSVLSIVVTKNGTDVAQFVGKDPASAIGWLSFDADHPEVPLKGSWLPYDPMEVSSDIICAAGSTSCSISLQSAGKKVTFALDKASAKGMNHVGVMCIKAKLADIPNGTRSIVDFDPDRILFYPTSGQSNLTAFFIPHVDSKADLTAMGSNSFISNGATAVWSNI
ncbi:hypothetical protein BJ165DRAFT_1533220 [Panaeolus papilionaceus]|nr:hypothetical protein BJ165DRAFT_1533220 [Panaeolus papilionaceus]